MTTRSAFYWRENMTERAALPPTKRRFNETLEGFKHRVRELREYGMTQKEVAATLGVSRRYVQMIEASLYGEGR